MKKAFTMLELVFVIVVVGILSYFAASSFQRNPLREAADQVVSHIRYTQHLAMQDDKFDPNDSSWYKRRWQLLLSLTANNTISYSILSDTPSSTNQYQGSPKANSTYTSVSVAKNPLNSNLYLIGTSYSTFDNSSEERLTSELNIKKKYSVQSVTLSNSCQLSGSTRIAFDYLGRPLKGTFHSFISPYPLADRLISQDCNITLTNGNQNVTITIKPETGYTYISSQNY
ncbi:prepilin-type N-terminal cleavage/methylation domain-containing protein [Sulfurospirillum halorespirans]|uniref:Prepilin-type n-terminal cleavage/methylation signal domain-containing protein n=1 Tax=Sulfurospirillum halorespirans DSM 13726 TaxID=1193502 RepID=A0A1D7TLH9_9BACT|nr:prepilin-type N-terminal cleavage/methylation domain-containing protein [Sulfurospirillum halorespirans]AOO65848.1 prepilin-type n-terminal cleavage/methylation signal domain-containing protein [Sulfurospirillum halorespirans DSM 13726]